MNSESYIPQTAHVKNLLRSIWQTGGASAFKTETIIPMGNIEIIFNFSDEPPIQAALGNKQFQLPKCFINGFNTMPVKIQLPDKHILLGVQLHPVAVKQLLGIPASEFADILVDLSLVDRSFNTLWNDLANKQSFDEKVSIIVNWLQSKLVNVQPREVFINNFLINELKQNISVPGLAKTVCYSTRQLSRKMMELTNLNTEDVLLYKKYLRAVHLIQHSNQSLTDIAYDSHFADQSHFIKTFRSFTQLTPAQYRQSKSPLQGHIFEHVR
ncbi:MAG: AraC family transcriptional regulator [Ferruginibacter sp.]